MRLSTVRRFAAVILFASIASAPAFLPTRGPLASALAQRVKAQGSSTLTKTSPATVYIGDTVVFASTIAKDVHTQGNPIRVQLLAYALDGPGGSPGSLVYVDALNVDGNGGVSFVYGGAASLLTQNPRPTHAVAELYYFTKQGPRNVLASYEFDSPGSH